MRLYGDNLHSALRTAVLGACRPASSRTAAKLQLHPREQDDDRDRFGRQGATCVSRAELNQYCDAAFPGARLRRARFSSERGQKRAS